jgi:xanthine dehydrogenase YagT iron-sulfur-binding subunit
MIDELGRGMPSHVSADLQAAPTLSNAELRERMSGNLCRCGAYSNIAEAIAQAAAAPGGGA